MDPAALRGRIGGTIGRGLLALPRGVQERLGAPAPAGAPELDPEARLLARVAARIESEPGSVEDVAGPAARREFEARAAAIGGRFRAPVEARDLAVAGLPARLYAPERGDPALLVFFHGGGWVRGSIASHDNACRMLAHRAGVRVLSVEYRLAPEHPWPAAAVDALAAYLDAAARAEELGADPARIAVGGDSAGGNLAAVCCLDARDGGHPLPAFQLLVYPGVDFSRKAASVREFASGWLLGEADIDRYKALYVPDTALWSDHRVSPLLASDHRGLPAAHVATAAADPLRDEGEAYARALEAAGVPVTVTRHPHVHGFLNMTRARAAGAAGAAIADELRAGLAAATSPGAGSGGGSSARATAARDPRSAPDRAGSAP